MALSTEIPRSFRLYVTHVDGEGHFLRISGQLDQQASLMIESLFETARENLENGVGAASPGSVHEGIICAAKYKDGTYYRAKVINMTNIATGLVGVHFIDFGNKDIISLSTIRFLDKYDPMFLQLRGQATDYYLSRVINPSGRWEEPILMKLQSLLCYSEYPVTLDAHTQSLPLISIQFKGNDLSTHLVSIRFGMAIPIAKQEVLLLQVSDSQHAPNWPSNFLNDAPAFSEHVPFLLNQSFPANPASAMRLQQNVALPFNGSVPASTSLISKRLLNNKVPRTSVNLKAPIRQPQNATGAGGLIMSNPPPATMTPPFPAAKPTSPKKATTYKSKLLEVKSQHKVFVSYAEEGPELFAVQLVSEAKKLQDMMDDINRRPHSSLAEPPMIGTVCLGRMSGDRIICRAIVMNLSGSQCKLFFVDFGDTEMISYYDIFDIPEEYVKPNVFAMRFCLSGVKKLEKGPHLNEVFKELASGKVLTLKVVAPEGPPLIQYGELYLDDKNVLDLLMANMKDNLRFKWPGLLPIGGKHSVLVSYVDSCIKFYIQLSDKIEDLNAVMEAVRVHCEKSSTPSELPVGASCCARFPDDGNWYRARVRAVTQQGKVVVAYVDYGNEQEVDVKDLRTITPDLVRLPAVAMKCALKGFENRPVETKTSNQLEMLALEKTLMCHVVGVVSSDTTLVTLVDDSVAPPLDIARKMNQLSQPRSSQEVKATTPVHKESGSSSSSPEGGGAAPDEGRRRAFRRERSFKDDQRPFQPSSPEGSVPEQRRPGLRRERPAKDEDVSPRGGPLRCRDKESSFERAGSGRHGAGSGSGSGSGGRTDLRHERNDRRGAGGPRPWENKGAAPPADDDWEEAHDDHQHKQPRQHNRDSDTKSNQQEEREERRSDDRGNRAGGRPDNRPDRAQRRDYNKDRNDFNKDRNDFNKDRNDFNREKKEFGNRKFPGREREQERGDKSFEDNKSDRSQGSGERAGRAPPFRPRAGLAPTHRELPDPVPLETPFERPTVELGSQLEVSVTWIVSPESFYTQILSLQAKFVEMMHGIPELYRGVKPYPGPVPVGASVLARYPADGVLYRASVVALQPFSKLIVRYVDFGNRQLVDARDVWQLDRRLLALPAAAVRCALAGVAPPAGRWRADAAVDLCFDAPRYRCHFRERLEPEDLYRVTLWSGGASVADALVERGLALAAEPLGARDAPDADEPIDMSLIAGQQLVCRVTHVAGYEELSVQLDLEKVARLEETMAAFDHTELRPPAPELVAAGTHCTVRRGGRLLRAVLQGAARGGEVRALLPDYGGEITASLDDVMILPSELSVYYYQALRCSLHGYSRESRALLAPDELRDKLVGNKFIVRVHEVDGITLVATLYELATGARVPLFAPEPRAPAAVAPLCARAVFGRSFGRAYVSHARALDELYLQRAADAGRLAALLADLYAFYEEGSSAAAADDGFEPQARALCAAKSSDGNWYRATVAALVGDRLEVHFPDYGNSELVARAAVRRLDPGFHEPCGLALVASSGLAALREDALATLLEWAGDRELRVTLTLGEDGWLAGLHLDGVDLAGRMIDEKLAAPRPRPEPEPEPEPEPAAPPEGYSQMYVSHIDTPGQFWLQPLEAVPGIEEIQAELQAGAASYPDVESRERGALCAAKYLADELWYRAEILDSDADITTVRFVDYGNTDVLDNRPGLLKAPPERLRAAERGALRCSVDAVPTGPGEWSEAASALLASLAGDPARPVLVRTVLRDAGATTYVDVLAGPDPAHLADLTDRLVRAGHAARADAPAGALPACFASHVNSPSEFWIQLESATADLQAMEAAMVDAAAFPALEGREEGALCAARYPEDGAWYRAQVVVDGSEGTEVLFMDYGNASIALELRALPDRLKEKPALSRKCALQKPRDIKAWSRASELHFAELAAEGATVFDVHFVASGDISIVELYLEAESVTERLVGLCEARPAERPAPARGPLADARLSYVRSLDEFYVHLEGSLGEVYRVTEALGAAADFDPVAELEAGSVCAAFWAEDERWYRARVLEPCAGGYRVRFLDYGNEAACEQFRRLPAELAAAAPLAACCRLAGLRPDPALRERARDKLDELALEDVTVRIEYLDSAAEPVLVKVSVDGTDLVSMLGADGPADARGEGSPDTDLETINKTVEESVPSIPEEESTKTNAKLRDRTGEENISEKIDERAERVASVVATLQVVDSAVETPKIVDSAVETPKVVHSAVETPKVVDSADETPKVVDSAIETPKVVDSAVETPKVVDSAVETPKVVDSADETPKVVNSAVETPKVVDSAVETPKVVDSAVETPKVVDSADETPKVVDSAVETPKVVDSAVETPKVVDSAVETPKVVDSADETPKVVDSAVETPKVVDSAVETPKVVDSAVETPKVVDSTDKDDEFDDAEDGLENEKLNTSLPDLDESMDSTQTVVENTSFDAQTDDPADDVILYETPSTPEQDGSGATLESSDDTIETSEKAESRDSINTDTGYTSGGDRDMTSDKDTTPGSPKIELSAERKVAEGDVIEEKRAEKVAPESKGALSEKVSDVLSEKDTAKETVKSQVSKEVAANDCAKEETN